MTDFDPIRSFADMRHEFGEHGGVNMSIETSSTFTVLNATTMPEIFQGRRGPEAGGCFLYGRHFNPTVYVLGRQIAALEGAQAGYCTSSGMGAISGTIMQLLDQGDHLIASDTVYGGTFALLKDYLPIKTGIDVSFVDITNLEEVQAAFRPTTKLVYTESIANPTLAIADIPKLSKIAHDHNTKLVVDNTFSPLIISPVQHGADIVVHSLTKFMNGASDLVGGAICGPTEFITDLLDLHTGSLMLLGPTMDARQAFSISMRLPHLGLRMKEHSERAQTFAVRLKEHGVPVVYPGLPDHPGHETLKEIMNPKFGFGGVLAIDLGDPRRANQFMEMLQNKDRFGFMAVSLGYFETLMSCSGSTTSSELTQKEQEKAKIPPGLVRMSLGITGTLEQRWEQLKETLKILNMIQ